MDINCESNIKALNLANSDYQSLLQLAEEEEKRKKIAEMIDEARRKGFFLE